MGSSHIRVDMANPFNKQVVFVFNIQICLIFLASKIINYFDIIAYFMVGFICLLLYLWL